MEASFLDLRNKSSEILDAIDRNESVVVRYRGHPKAIIHPISAGRSTIRTEDHAAFGLWRERTDLTDVTEHVRNLRRGRFHDR